MTDPLPTSFLRAIHRAPALRNPNEQNLPSRNPQLPIEGAAHKEAANDAVRRELEPSALRKNVGNRKAQKTDSSRFLIRVTSVRKLLLDDDNLCEKFVVDCCRYAGAVPNDSPATTRIETAQRKASKGEDERTIVEIYELPDQPAG